MRGESAPHNDLIDGHGRDGNVHEHFSLDPGLVRFPVWAGPQPRFESAVLDETEEFRLVQDDWGIRKRMNKKSPSVPEPLEWAVSNREDFERVREERFTPALSGRAPENLPDLAREYANRDFPVTFFGCCYGIYGTLRNLMGDEKLLTSFYDEPGLVREMMAFFTDFYIQLAEEMLSFVKPDCANFWEDIAYKTAPLISPAMFSEFMRPCYRRLTGFLREHGVATVLVGCDGNLEKLIPLFLEAGVTGLYPVEVNAGNDVVAIRKSYPRLQLMGGLSKQKAAQGKAAIDEELDAKVPWMLSQGGYVPHIDHHVHPEVSFKDFTYYRTRLNELIEKQGEHS